MIIKTEILTNITEASACAENWLERATEDGRNANWNNDRFAYMSRHVLIGLHKNNWLNDIDNISKFYSKTNRTQKVMTELVNHISVTHEHGSPGDSHIFQIVSLLLLHLSFEAHVKLRFGHQIHLPQRPESLNWFCKRGLIVDSVLHVYMASTPARFVFFRSALPQKYRPFLEELGDNQRATRQRAGMNLIEALTYSRVKSLDDVSVETFADYYKINSEASNYYLKKSDKRNKVSTITYGVFMGMLDSANGTTIRRDYDKLMSGGSLTVVAENSGKPKNKTFVKTVSSRAEVSKLTCDHLEFEQFEVDTEIREINLITIGEFSFSVRNNLAEFRPKYLQNNGYWKSTQLDFISRSGESGTKKSRQNRLAYLNSYLFDYLPTFFKNNPDCGLTYPSSPSEFLSFVFVSHSNAMATAFWGDQVQIVYPVGLLDYIYAITEEKALAQGYTRTNSGRDAIATIQRYFEFVM
tara:strand:+ start:376 stop:1776 length:1401 start_codon:yes stop_codon:yes gene_type:complete